VLLLIVVGRGRGLRREASGSKYLQQSLVGIIIKLAILLKLVKVIQADSTSSTDIGT